VLTRARTALGSALAAVLVLGVLAGCGDDDNGPGEGESAKPSPTTSTTSSAAPYLDVPEDVELTEPGTELPLGAEGVIAWEPRQDRVVAAGVTVRRIERTSFQESFPGWKVDDVTAARTPYFVRLTVTNPAAMQLSGVRPQLWGADDGGTLEAPNFYDEQQLPSCSGTAGLPATLDAGTPYDLCQVYFIAPGRTLQSITFQPPGDVEPITWAGEISKVEKPKKKKKKAKKKP
jgi:hypothetical protein